jgi:predicted dienelactone hydrolase
MRAKIMSAVLPVLPLHDVLGQALPDGRGAIVWRWTAASPARGSIVFSHGMGSAPWKYSRLVVRWLAEGYDVWAPWHVDSRDHPLNAAYPGLLTWRARIEDMRVASALVGAPYVAAGHSYGALTALVMGGALGDRPEGLSGPLRDPAARCVIALSPPPPIPGLISREGYGAIAVPALVQTGSHDVFPGEPFTADAWRVHLPAHEAAPADGGHYLLFLEDVDHYFGNAICETDRTEPPQIKHLNRAVNIASLFMDAYFPEPSTSARDRLHTRLIDHGPVRLALR